MGHAQLHLGGDLNQAKLLLAYFLDIHPMQ